MNRLIIFSLLCLLNSCISYKPVMITGISNVKTTSVEGNSMELGLDFEIYNPNGFRIVMKQYDIDVLLNDKSLGKAGSVEKIVIKGRSKESHPFKLRASYADFMAATVTGLGSLFKNEPVTFKVKGVIKGRIWWFRKTIPIETTQQIRL